MLKTLYLVIAGWVMALGPICALVSPTFPEPQHCSSSCVAVWSLPPCILWQPALVTGVLIFPPKPAVIGCWQLGSRYEGDIHELGDFRDGAQWSVLLEPVRSREDLWRSSWEHLTQVLYD